MQMPESPFLTTPGMPYGETGEFPIPEMPMQDSMMSSEPTTLDALRAWLHRLKSQMEQEMLEIERRIEEARDRSPISVPSPTEQVAPSSPLAPPDLMGQSSNQGPRNVL